MLNGLALILKRLNTRRYKRRRYVEERIQKLSQGNPAKGLVDIGLAGNDGALTLAHPTDVSPSHRRPRRAIPSRARNVNALDARWSGASHTYTTNRDPFWCFVC